MSVPHLILQNESQSLPASAKAWLGTATRLNASDTRPTTTIRRAAINWKKFMASSFLVRHERTEHVDQWPQRSPLTHQYNSEDVWDHSRGDAPEGVSR